MTIVRPEMPDPAKADPLIRVVPMEPALLQDPAKADPIRDAQTITVRPPDPARADLISRAQAAMIADLFRTEDPVRTDRQAPPDPLRQEDQVAAAEPADREMFRLLPRQSAKKLQGKKRTEVSNRKPNIPLLPMLKRRSQERKNFTKILNRQI
jgi:hypothetical protein